MNLIRNELNSAWYDVLASSGHIYLCLVRHSTSAQWDKMIVFYSKAYVEQKLLQRRILSVEKSIFIDFQKTRQSMAAIYSKKLMFIFYVLNFWVPLATSLQNETCTKWKFEPFATFEYQFCWRKVENERSRPNLRLAIGDIFIVNQWFLKKMHQKPKLRTQFSRKN